MKFFAFLAEDIRIGTCYIASLVSKIFFLLIHRSIVSEASQESMFFLGLPRGNVLPHRLPAAPARRRSPCCWWTGEHQIQCCGSEIFFPDPDSDQYQAQNFQKQWLISNYLIEVWLKGSFFTNLFPIQLRIRVRIGTNSSLFVMFLEKTGINSKSVCTVSFRTKMEAVILIVLKAIFPCLVVKLYILLWHFNWLNFSRLIFDGASLSGNLYFSYGAL